MSHKKNEYTEAAKELADRIEEVNKDMREYKKGRLPFGYERVPNKL